MGKKKKIKNRIVELVREFVDNDCHEHRCFSCPAHPNNLCCNLTAQVSALKRIEEEKRSKNTSDKAKEFLEVTTE